MPLQTISSADLNKALDDHAAWVDSGGLAGWLTEQRLAGPPEGIQGAAGPLRGRQANLSEHDLRGADLRGRKLPGAVLEGSDLARAQLQSADLAYARLRRTIFTDANLAGATFYQADLTEADLRRVMGEESGVPGPDLTDAVLRSADLRQANLATARGLRSGSFADCNLTDARLPEAVAKFDTALAQLAETSKSGALAFVATLAACGYAWLTIASTNDLQLIKNTSTSPLPLAGTDIAIAGFYSIAPVILFGAYLYLHLYLVRLWQALGTLPAFFPDGTPLDQKAYPWLLNGLVRSHFMRLRPGQNRVGRVEAWLCLLLAWWLVPITLVAFWGRYLPRHDWQGTSLQVVLVVVSATSALLFYQLASERLLHGSGRKAVESANVATLRTLTVAAMLFLILGLLGAEGVAGLPKLILILGMAMMVPGFYLVFGEIRGLHIAPSIVLTMLLFAAASAGALRGHRTGITGGLNPSWPVSRDTLVPDALRLLGLSASAALTGQDISTKPADWTGSAATAAKELAEVKGARLAGANLRFADADQTFLAKADLKGANLRYVRMAFADLRGADLSRADLRDADLSFTRLQGANLSGARLDFAELNGTRFDNANLSYAYLGTADMVFTQFKGANLNHANLRSLPPNAAGALKDACVGAPWDQPTLPDTDEYRNIVLPHCAFDIDNIYK